MNSYSQIYRDATLDKAGFWLDAATAIDWVQTPKTGLDDGNPSFCRWFPAVSYTHLTLPTKA